MTAARSSIHPALTALTALGALMLAAVPPLAAQEPATAADATELKWTPHRAGRPVGETVAPPAEPAIESPAVSAPAASVRLPDGVPPVASRPTVVREAPYVPPRRQPPQAALPSLGDAWKNFYDPGSPDAVLGMPIMRTPRGPASRPILAPEGQQAQAMRAAADRAALGDDRLGGGLAPRYDVGRAAASGRPERLAKIGRAHV